MKDQVARNVWSVNLNVENESEKRLYIKSGTINWNQLQLEEQDAAMIDIIVLLIVTATPSRSILCDNPYRNVPKQKLRRSLMETLPGPSVDNGDPLMEYVNFKYKQDMQIDGELNESLEIDLLRVNLEASTNIRADTVDLLVEKLKSVEITDDPSQASSIIRELSSKFAGNEKVFQNEYFVESASQKIIEKQQLEIEEQRELCRKRKISQEEIASEEWIKDFIKKDFQLAFMAVMRFKLGQKIPKKGETLLLTLGIPEELGAERIVVPDDASDRLIFYFSVMFLVTNMTTAPIIGAAPELTEGLAVLRGEVHKSKLPSLYAVPPLRICKSLKRKAEGSEQNQAKRSYE